MSDSDAPQPPKKSRQRHGIMVIREKDAPAEFQPCDDWPAPEPSAAHVPTEPAPPAPDPEIVPFLTEDEIRRLRADEDREVNDARAKLNAGAKLTKKERDILKRSHAESTGEKTKKDADDISISRACDDLDVWWVNGDGGTFQMRDGGENWLEVKESKLTLSLIRRGLQNPDTGGLFLNDAQKAILHITQKRTLDRSIEALAGYRSGIHRVKGFRILIRRGPVLIEPKQGEFMLIENLLAQRLVHDDGNRVQFDRFNLWMQRACESLYGDSQLNTQVLILAGPAGSAKSRLQHMIVTPLLGGRSADPSRYVFGETTFNEGWMGCEHLLIEDPRPSMKLHDRLQFAQILKSLTVNEDQSLHAKGKAEFGTNARFAVTISINDDPDSLRILPPLTPDFRDKVMLFKVLKRELPMPTRTPAERKAFRDAVTAELPAYLWWLMNDLKAPESVASERFGVLHYQDPDLCVNLWEDTPSGELLALLDGTEILDTAGNYSDTRKFFKSYGTHEAAALLKQHAQAPESVKLLLQTASRTFRRVWVGSAEELQDALEKCKHRTAAKKLIDHNAVSRMLARLAEDKPERVIQYRSRAKRLWMILSPEPMPDTAEEEEPGF